MSRKCTGCQVMGSDTTSSCHRSRGSEERSLFRRLRNPERGQALLRHCLGAPHAEVAYGGVANTFHMRFGDIEVRYLDGGNFWLDGGAMFGVVPKVFWNKKSPPDGNNPIRLRANSLRVRAHA